LCSRLFVYRYLTRTFRHLRSRGVVTTFRELYASTAQVCPFIPPWTVSGSVDSHPELQAAFKLILLAPHARRKLEQELAKVSVDIRSKVAPAYPDLERHISIPQTGKEKDWIHTELEKLQKIGEGHWETGRVSGAVYHGGDDLSDIIRDGTPSPSLPCNLFTYDA
jgi:sphinganine-1-phosphate aldolase